MADTKLSALVELAATPAVDDEVYIRDVSEAAADESKRITTANLLASKTTLTIGETEVFAANSPDPSAWADLDLSAVVGANACLVIIKVVFTTTAADYTFSCRRNGDTDEAYVATIVGGSASVGQISKNTYMTFLVPTDTSGIIEWRLEGVTQAMTIDVIAYIK